MTIQAIHSTESLHTKSPSSGSGALAILAALSLVRDTLSKEGQTKQGEVIEKLLESGLKIQDKLQREHKRLVELNAEAIKKQGATKVFDGIAQGLFIASIVLSVVAPAGALSVKAVSGTLMQKAAGYLAIAGKAGLAAAPTVFAFASSIFKIVSEFHQLDAVPLHLEIAEINGHNQRDMGLDEVNQSMIEFSGSTMAETAKARLALQKVITEIINAEGNAKYIAATG